MKRNGFTLVELIVVISIFSLLASFITLNLTSSRNKSSADSVLMQLVSNIRQQQMRAMAGRSGVTSSGLYFTPTSYVLFDGATYNGSDPANLSIVLPSDISFTSISAPNNQIVFQKPSGELTSVSSITVASNGGASPKTVTINLYGVPSVN